MTLMSRGATWLASRLQTAGGEVVTFEPGNSPPLSITAVLKETDRTIAGEEGFDIAIAPYTWLILASEIPGVIPRKGHRIKRSDGETFQVLPPSDGEQEATIDRTGTIWTVHAKRINEANG